VKHLAALQQAFDAMTRSATKNDLDALWRSDRRFHWAFLEASGNSRVAAYVDAVRELLLRRDAVTVRRGRGALEIVADHRPILDAIVAGDPETAAAAVRAHLQHTLALLLDSRATTDGR